ncbi:ImuA family protein [Ahrensia marina]|uniref:ImuA family protein n=1 Tax=Ahrensia marina TaxID=1514904 RepID=UPI0006B5CA2C|nr:hypothetical protein [Ahrensia marina]
MSSSSFKQLYLAGGMNERRRKSSLSVACANDLESTQDSSQQQTPWKLGIERIDEFLPSFGLSQSGLHEIAPLKTSDMPCLTGFVFGLLSRLQTDKPIIWCITASQIGDYGHPYAFGLSRFAVSPAQIIFAKVTKDKSLPFAMEEALKTDGVGAVIGEGPRPCFTGSRRLSLLCKTHQTPCLSMTTDSHASNGSSALTRWQVAPQHGVEDPRDPYGPGLPTWAVALPRVRYGRTMPALDDQNVTQNKKTNYPWRIVWDDQTLSFSEASVFSSRALFESSAPNREPPKALVG